ncbi:methyl-accepting chemotaxis protein [Microcystis aeruginosa]|uniref:methyl-accepting chemotaxis protein n=1 Tax=Microcystis aeruginosa TaxID=1126 RepID=UPI0020A41CB9|nr:methyl-accepting chemotaxis protein [Microcystis aeruginosa]
MALLNLFPPYLIVLTLVLVIFPTVLAVGIRITLYKHLQDSTKKVKGLIPGESSEDLPIISKFKEASGQLDDVNTAALVDSLYHEEKFTFMSKSLSCEKWDYFVRVLPNLLLAFGLLGTFLGITLNLTGISTLIDINNVDVQSLGEKLKTPLESMGIAFITSLIGLACSSLLTVINLIFNTNLAKVNLISSLEDYLDNILQPTVEGNSRLDKAVNRMVDTQKTFLNNFHEEVKIVLEKSLGKVAKEIADGNQETAKLVTQVCERLTETAGTLSTGATTFQRSAFELNEQVPIITQANREFTQSSQELKNSVLLFKQASELIEKSNFSGNIERFTASLAETQGRFSQSTAILEQNIGEIISSNKRANDLAEQVYLNIQESSQKLQNSALGFLEASEKIESSQFADKLVQATADLMTAHQQFADSTTDLNQSTQSLASLTQDFQRSMTTMVELGIKITDLNQKSEKILEQNQQRLVTEQEKLSNIQGELVKLIETVKTYQDSFNSESKQLGNQLINRLDERLSQTSDKILTASHGIERSSNNPEVTNANLSQLIDTVTEQVTQVKESLQSELNLLSNNLGMVVDDKLTKNSEQLKAVSQSIEKTANQFGSLKSDFSQVINAVNTNTSQLTSNLESLRDKLEKVIAKENKSNQKMIEHIYGEIQKCLAELEKIGEMSSEFSNLKDKMKELKELFETIPNPTQKDVQDDIDKLNKKLEELKELFETIPNLTQKNVQSEFSILKDEMRELFETIPNPPQKNVQDDIDKLNKKLEELKKLFETIPNPTQKDVQSEFSSLKDKIEKLFETIPNPTQKNVQDDINTIFDNFTNKF